MRKRIADTRGFTLIELLVVCVVIGALASMAIIQMNSSKDRAFVAAMENDLRNVAAAQQAVRDLYRGDTTEGTGDCARDHRV